MDSLVAWLTSPTMTYFTRVLVYLMAAHYLFDYPLQGDFLSRGKNHKHPIPGVPWYQCLWAHASLHGAAVLFVTHSMGLATAELFIHAVIDYAKSAGVFGDGERAFDLDQFLHYVCKWAWAILATVMYLHSMRADAYLLLF